MVPEEDIIYWQEVWKKILDMAYYGGQPIDSLCADRPINPEWQYDDDFIKLTFDYMWAQYSMRRDENGEYIKTQSNTTLKKLSVPYTLFFCLGVSSLMRVCFPNCKIAYWE